MRVIYKPTGQLGEIPEDKFDPTLFSVADTSRQAAQVAPALQPTESITSRFGNFLIDALFGATKKAFVNAPQRISEGPQSLQEVGVSALGPLGQLLFGSPRQKEAARAGAEIASYNPAIAFGKGAGILSKALFPGATVGGLQATSREDATPQSVIGGAALGATGAGVLQGALGLGGKVAQAGGKALTKTGEGLALRSLRPSPSQQARFAKETGEKLGDFLKKRGLEGAGFEQIETKISPLQNSFDEAGSAVSIKAKDILGKFNEQIARLKQSILPADKTKVSALNSIVKNFKKRYGAGDIGGDIITSLRQDVDKGIRDFNLDEAVKGPLNIVRDILQGSIRDAADKAGIKIGKMSMKESGIELSKLYKLQDIAGRQQYLGQGGLPLNLTTLLGGIAGGAAGGGIPGVLGSALATRVLNAPAATSLESRVATGLGGKLAGASPQLGRISGQISARGASPLMDLLFGRGQQPQYETQEDTTQKSLDQVSPPPESISQGVKITRDQMMQVLLSPDISKVTKDLVKQAYDLQPGEGKPLPVAAQQQKFLAQRGTRGIQEANKILESDPNVLAKQLIPGQWLSRKFDSTMYRAVEALLRSASGAAIPETEVRRYLSKFGPIFGDSKDVVTFKMQQLQQDFNDILNGVTNSRVEQFFVEGQ